MPSDPGFTIESTPRELENARTLARQGRLPEAEQAFRRVLEVQPQQTEALRFLANAALSRGAAGEAVDLLNRAAVVDRNDIGVLMELGVAYRAADRVDESRYVLERALETSGGRSTAARLLLANVLEQDGRDEPALLHYFRAILDAQRERRWLDDASTEPGLRQLVRHAMAYVAQGRRAWFEAALQPLRRGNDAELARVERALALYLRERDEPPDDPRQRAGFLYVPGLGDAPFIERSNFGWLDDLLARVAGCGGEVAACLAQQPDAAPADASPFSLGTLMQDGAAAKDAPPPSERHVSIHQRGLLNETARAHAPRLLAALAETPLVHIPRHGPDATLVALEPGARSTLRYGRTNSRCSVAIGLPGSARMRVLAGGEARALDAGEACVFDPVFGFEYVNDGDAQARLLAFEAWHPGLTPPEREAIAAITGAAVEFDSRLQDLA